MEKKIKELVQKLNTYRDEYYNKSNSLVSDYEYDTLFDELLRLETETGIIFSNSPTQTVGYEVKSELEKIEHSHSLLSLQKTKSVNELIEKAGNKETVLSLKMDGLTILLTYEEGKLVQAETRGNGIVGELVTHNAKVFENIPLQISYLGHLEVEGEAIITYNDFTQINQPLPVEMKYKNPRNLVSGSVRQLDSSIAAKRHIRFITWKVPTDVGRTFTEKMIFVEKLGFEIVPFYTYVKGGDIGAIIETLKDDADKLNYPIDGLVMTYNDIKYGESLGFTNRHPRHSIAFKFYDEEVETVLRNIEWTMGKTGVLTPTAVFDPVEIEGTTVERASLHNISIMKNLELSYGDIITVYKANAIIPQIADNLDRTLTDICVPPVKCPVCGMATKIVKDNKTEILVCGNSECKGKFLGKLKHFVSRDAINIDGLSEAKLERIIKVLGISSFKDLYHLKGDKAQVLEKVDGFGKKSVDKLLEAIEKSRNTTLKRFIYALSIPLIGESASKAISMHLNGSFNEFIEKGGYKWSTLPDFGSAMEESLNNYMSNNKEMIEALAEEFTFEMPISKKNSEILAGKTFVITGKLQHFTNRTELKNKLSNLGAVVVDSVSKNTTYLVNNDVNSSSSKNVKAKQLGVQIINEEQLSEMFLKGE